MTRQTAGRRMQWEESLLMRALRREPTERPPVWLMRQAGRYMAEYRAVREKTGFLELCRNPRLCAEVMLTAVDKLGVDAAIIFSDLLPILEPMGFGLEFTTGDGPVIHHPVRESGDVDRVRALVEPADLEPVAFVFETVAETRRHLDPGLPLIGFAGAPFTLAGYAIEGGGSRDFRNTKTFMYRHGDAWAELMRRLADTLAAYLNAQIDAGAQVVQIFDSWVGCLSDGDYRRFVLPYTKRLIDQVRGAPLIHFATGNPALLPLMREAGGDAFGVDWRLSIDLAWDFLGRDRAIQGNLDPAILLTDPETVEAAVRDLLRLVAGQPGHIVNLGHGVLPQTPVENAQALVRAVREYRPGEHERPRRAGRSRLEIPQYDCLPGDILQYTSRNEEQTRKLGRRLAEVLPDGSVCALVGTLGAGKTRLVQGVVEGCGIPPGTASSPTFVLIREYDEGERPVYHFDAYRLESEAEFLKLGPEEYFEGDGLSFVEWADRVAGALPEERIEIHIEVIDETTRLFVLYCFGARYEGAFAKLHELPCFD